MKLRSVSRVILALLLVASFGWSGWCVWSLATGWPGSVFIERSADEIVAETDRAMAQVATPDRLEEILEARLAEEPPEWISIEAIEAVAVERNIVLPAPIVEEIEAARAERPSFLTRCVICAWDIASCDLSPALFCQVVVVTPVGDIAAIATEIWNFSTGAEVDEINLGLSTVGLAGTLLVLPTGGSAAVLAAGAKAVKTVHKMGRLSPGVARAMRNAVEHGIDWAGVRRLGPAAIVQPDELRKVIRPTVFTPVVDLAHDVGRIGQEAGVLQGAALFSRIDDANDARRTAAGAEALGPRTLGRFEVLGKSRFLRATMRWSDNVWELVGAVTSLVASFLGFVLSASSNAGLRWLRRRAAQRRGVDCCDRRDRFST